MVKGDINSRSAQPILLWSVIKVGDGNGEENIIRCQNSTFLEMQKKNSQTKNFII